MKKGKQIKFVFLLKENSEGLPVVMVLVDDVMVLVDGVMVLLFEKMGSGVGGSWCVGSFTQLKSVLGSSCLPIV